MAQTAPIHDPDPAPPEPKPTLQLVRESDGDDATAPEAVMPNVGRTAMIGYVVGFVVATVVITVAGTLAALGFGASLGLGVFVGVWGGGGFGFMMGGTLPFARHLDAQSARSTHHRQGATK